MSGVRIDLDAARDQNAFSKAEIVIEDNEKNQQEPPAVPQEKLQEPSQPSAIVEQSLDDLIAAPKRPSERKATVTSDDGREEIKLRSQPIRSSSSRAIAEAILDVVKSSRKSEIEESKKSSRMISERILSERVRSEKPARLPPVNEAMKPVEPEMSDRMKEILKEKDVVETAEEHVDMMPKTDTEKFLYWKTRLQILKTRFPDVTIPKNCADLDWSELRKMYYIEMDRVSISKNVETYKMVMIVMFFILEYIGTKFLKIDIVGFSTHSMKSMIRYERLLIELGEKNYSSFADNWPVELRLGGMVLVSAIIYVIAKYIYKMSGQDMSDDFFNFFQTIGSQTVEADLPPGAGMDTPGPGAAAGGGGGMMGMLSGLLGAFGGGGGGLGDIGKMFAGMAPPAGNPKAATEESTPGDGDDPNRVKPPTYRRKRKPKANTE